jgi:hypothetical protein
LCRENEPTPPNTAMEDPMKKPQALLYPENLF